MIRFIFNREEIATPLPAGTVTLGFVRHHGRLTDTKEGCREGDCGACLVLVISLASRHLVTIEGLNRDGLNPIQRALVEEGAVQCGFCTPGFIVSFLGLLLSAPRWTVANAHDALAGNLCRCTDPVRSAAGPRSAATWSTPRPSATWPSGCSRWTPMFSSRTPRRGAASGCGSFPSGYKQLDLCPGEIVTHVSFPVPSPPAVFGFEKVTRRPHLDIASVNSAMLAVRHHGELSPIHLSAGGVGPVPLYLARAVGAMAGKPVTAATYKRRRRRRRRNLLVAHFLKLAPELE